MFALDTPHSRELQRAPETDLPFQGYRELLLATPSCILQPSVLPGPCVPLELRTGVRAEQPCECNDSHVQLNCARASDSPLFEPRKPSSGRWRTRPLLPVYPEPLYPDHTVAAPRAWPLAPAPRCSHLPHMERAYVMSHNTTVWRQVPVQTQRRLIVRNELASSDVEGWLELKLSNHSPFCELVAYSPEEPAPLTLASRFLIVASAGTYGTFAVFLLACLIALLTWMAVRCRRFRLHGYLPQASFTGAALA